MKLMEGIKILQKNYPEYIILVKNGLFYNAIGKDAILLSKEFRLKKICFSKEVCKVGVNENTIADFTEKLIQKDYKYIIYNYIKGDFKDIDEQFIEKERKDKGIFLEKEKYIVDCQNCEYYKRIKQRENIFLSSKKIVKGKEKSNKIFEKKKQLEKYIQNISKITNEYLNFLINEYLMEEENE